MRISIPGESTQERIDHIMRLSPHALAAPPAAATPPAHRRSGPDVVPRIGMVVRHARYLGGGDLLHVHQLERAIASLVDDGGGVAAGTVSRERWNAGCYDILSEPAPPAPPPQPDAPMPVCRRCPARIEHGSAMLVCRNCETVNPRDGMSPVAAEMRARGSATNHQLAVNAAATAELARVRAEMRLGYDGPRGAGMARVNRAQWDVGQQVLDGSTCGREWVSRDEAE